MKTPIKAHFIYTPRSGDRTLAVVPSDEVVIVTWPNASRHAVGRLRQVEIEAAVQGRWFRRDAREVAARFVEMVGDECGMIHLLVPDGWQEVAVDLVAAAEHQQVEDLVRVGREVVASAETRGLALRHRVPVDVAKYAKYKDLEPDSIEGGCPDA